MTFSAFRSSWKRWKSRPPANCRSARDAWDWFAKNGAPDVPDCVWLADGYWMCEFVSGLNDEFEHSRSNVDAARKARHATP